MAKYVVLSFNPKTKHAELMRFKEDLGAAETHANRAIREGRLLVEIIDSPSKHAAWRRRAKKLIASIPG